MACDHSTLWTALNISSFSPANLITWSPPQRKDGDCPSPCYRKFMKPTSGSSKGENYTRTFRCNHRQTPIMTLCCVLRWPRIPSGPVCLIDIFLFRCEEYFLCKYQPPEGVHSVGEHIELEIKLYLERFPPQQRYLRRLIFDYLLKRESCITGKIIWLHHAPSSILCLYQAVTRWLR